ELGTAINTGHLRSYDDGLTLSASYGTVVKHNDGTWSWSASGEHAGTQTVTITATNDDGSVSTTMFAVTFSDVAPLVSSDQASVTVAETALATNTGHWSDYDDGLTLSASYGTVVKHNDGTWSWS